MWRPRAPALDVFLPEHVTPTTARTTCWQRIGAKFSACRRIRARPAQGRGGQDRHLQPDHAPLSVALIMQPGSPNPLQQDHQQPQLEAPQKQQQQQPAGPVLSVRGAGPPVQHPFSPPPPSGVPAALWEMDLQPGLTVGSATLERWATAYRRMALDARDLGIPGYAIPQLLRPEPSVADLRAARDRLAGCIASFLSSGL